MAKYVCGTCGANATKNPLIKTEDAKGSLGTWHCTRGCGKRSGSIVRFVGSGKEEDSQGSKIRMESISIVRKLAVVRG